MKYDVFLASALNDRDMAELVVRRLRALKFKVRYDKTRTSSQLTDKDVRDANASQSVVVLWSAAAMDRSERESAWVHAIAEQALTRDGVLVQVGLDETVPDDPFHLHERYLINGMTTRTTPEDFYRLIEDLGARDGRKDLREWMLIPARDSDAQDAWRKRHPGDPLSQKGRTPSQTGAAAASATGASATGAAALATGLAATATRAPAASPPPPPSPRPAEAVIAAARDPAPVAAPVAFDESLGWGTLMTIALAIAAMLFFAWIVRTQPAPASGGPAISNAVMQSCPAGTIDRRLLYRLETGPIINDTDGETGDGS